MNYKKSDNLKIYRDAKHNKLDPMYNDLSDIKEYLFMIINKVFIIDTCEINKFMNSIIKLLRKLKQDDKLCYLNDNSIHSVVLLTAFHEQFKLASNLLLLLYPKESLIGNAKEYFNEMNNVIDRMHSCRYSPLFDEKVKDTFLEPILDITDIERDSWQYKSDRETRDIFTDIGRKAFAYYYANTDRYNLDTLRDTVYGIKTNYKGIFDYFIMNGIYPNTPIHDYNLEIYLIDSLFNKLENENKKTLIK
jgi:hypothetical protein